MIGYITPDELLDIYRAGSFPMADKGEDEDFYIVTPHMRGIIPINPLHIPKRLARTVKQHPFDIRLNTRFQEVIEQCAVTHDTRQSTWINKPIRDLFCELHEMGYAHSVECFLDDELVGGLYGLSLGQVFCGESMFSRRKDASKIALVHLAQHLNEKGFQLLDAQLSNPHLLQFGLIEIPQDDYVRNLHTLMNKPAKF